MSRHVADNASVFIVMREVPYERTDSIRAFTSEPAARAFADQCNDYERKRPLPDFEAVDTPEDNAKYDAWKKRMTRWEKRHPAGKDQGGGDFSVTALPMCVSDTAFVQQCVDPEETRS